MVSPAAFAGRRQLYPTCRKPFDLIAEGVKSADWLAFQDKFRNFCNTEEVHYQELFETLF
jgi:hypothetical protein